MYIYDWLPAMNLIEFLKDTINSYLTILLNVPILQNINECKSIYIKDASIEMVKSTVSGTQSAQQRMKLKLILSSFVKKLYALAISESYLYV